MKTYRNKTTEQRRQEFIATANNIHNNKYQYNKVIYINTHTKVIINCPTHGEFLKTPVKHISEKSGCQQCAAYKRVADKTRFVDKQSVYDAASKIHQHQYSYQDVIIQNGYITTNDKIVVKCHIHGTFTQSINKHIYQKTGCKKCSVIHTAALATKSKEQFIVDGINIHGQYYDYSNSVYLGAHTKICIDCPVHGSFYITPANHTIHQQGCNICSASAPEIIIRQFLKEHDIDFIYQHKFLDCVSPLTDKMLKFDFYLPALNTLIEYDGIYHYQPICHNNDRVGAVKSFERQQLNDETKNIFACKNGYTLIRIPYFDNLLIRERLSQLFSEKYESH